MSKIKLKRHTFVRNGVGIVPLTKGMEAIIDIDMVDHIGSYNWYEQNGYASRTSFGKRVAMHQQVMEYAGIYVGTGLIPRVRWQRQSCHQNQPGCWHPTKTGIGHKSIQKPQGKQGNGRDPDSEGLFLPVALTSPN